MIASQDLDDMMTAVIGEAGQLWALREVTIFFAYEVRKASGVACAGISGKAIDAMGTNADGLINCCPLHQGSLTNDTRSGKFPLVSEPVICAKVN